jgi:drug/metabolite transporter (DMT)-like permease
MRIAVETIPPFTVAGSRFLMSGFMVFLYLRLRGMAWPTLSQWKSAALIGCLLMVGGNGLVMWAVQKIPSGIAALVVATMPLWMTLFDWLFYKGPRPTPRIVVGLLLGLLGIVFLIGPADLMAGKQYLHLPSMLILLLAPIFWSIGSLQMRYVDLPRNVFMATAMEAICGGFVLILLSVAFGEPNRLDFGLISFRSIGATVYLAIFGSLLALTAYSWLLQHVNAGRVSTYTFVNPVIAVALGWLILDERISWETVVAVILIVAAVVLIVMRKIPTAAARVAPKTVEA